MFFHLSCKRSTQPLTDIQFQIILHPERCTPVYRFSHVFARDQHEQEYYLCQYAQLATLSPRQCRELLLKALSYRLQK